MLLKRVVRFLKRAHPTRAESLVSSQDSCVRLIHAGGREELYPDAVTVFQIIEKYPGMVVARPQVFRVPHESVLWPQETLVPGQKYYMIPSPTLKKLMRRHQNKATRRGDGLFIDEESDAEDCGREECWEKGVRFFRRRKVAVVAKKKKRFGRPVHVERGRSMGWEPSLSSVKELSL